MPKIVAIFVWLLAVAVGAMFYTFSDKYFLGYVVISLCMATALLVVGWYSCHLPKVTAYSRGTIVVAMSFGMLAVGGPWGLFYLLDPNGVQDVTSPIAVQQATNFQLKHVVSNLVDRLREFNKERALSQYNISTPSTIKESKRYMVEIEEDEVKWEVAYRRRFSLEVSAVYNELRSRLRLQNVPAPPPTVISILQFHSLAGRNPESDLADYLQNLAGFLPSD